MGMNLICMPNGSFLECGFVSGEAVGTCPIQDVLQNQDLVCYILKFMTPEDGMCLRTRSRLATVCKSWRHAVQQGVPAALHLSADFPVKHLDILLHNTRVLSNICTISVERGAPSLVQRLLLQILTTCASQHVSSSSLRKLSGVVLYATALAELATRFPNLKELSCSCYWGHNKCSTWLPSQLQDLDFTLDSRYRMSALLDHSNEQLFQTCTELRSLTLRGFSKVPLAHLPPSVEHLRFYEASDVSNGTTLGLSNRMHRLSQVSVILPGVRRRDGEGNKKLAAAKVTPGDHWHFASVLEYVGVKGQLFEVQSSDMTIGWDVSFPDKVACRQAARDFLQDFLSSHVKQVTFWTAAFQLVVSVRLQNNAFNPYLTHGLSAADMAYYIDREYKGVVQCKRGPNFFTLTRVRPCVV
eukprot:jgi/Botrbrau1/10645/Bobra.53_2s0004.1